MLTFAVIGAEQPDASAIPTSYRGISFTIWLDMFCEYALCLAKRGRNREAYDICEAAIHAIVYCFSKDDMFTLHIAYTSKLCRSGGGFFLAKANMLLQCVPSLPTMKRPVWQ